MAINILMTRLKIQNFVCSFIKVLTSTQSQRAIQTQIKWSEEKARNPWQAGK
jgi:hypothetical protein